MLILILQIIVLIYIYVLQLNHIMYLNDKKFKINYSDLICLSFTSAAILIVVILFLIEFFK